MTRTSSIARRLLAALILILFIVSMTACGAADSGETVTKAETREDVNRLAEAFLEESLKKTNFTMNITLNGELVTTFTRDGDTAKVTDSQMGDTYAFVDAGKYCVAYTDEEVKGVYESKESYYDPLIDGLRFWLELFMVNEDDSDNADWSFSAVQTDKAEDNNKTSTFELNAEGKLEGKDASQAVKATSQNGLVDKIEAAYNDGSQTQNYVIEVEYDNAQIILPDFSGYEHNSYEG